MGNRWGKNEDSDRLYFLGLQNQCQQSPQPRNWKTLAPLNKSYDKPRQHIKKQRHHFANKCSYRQSYGFSISHVWMCESDHKENWAPKNWCYWTVQLEKTLESPWTGRKSNQSVLKEISPEYSSEGLMLKLKLLYFGHLDAKNWLIWKDPDAGNDWRREEKGTTEDEMIGCHHWLNGHEFEQTQGDSEGQGSLACCSSWGWKENNNSV